MIAVRCGRGRRSGARAAVGPCPGVGRVTRLTRPRAARTLRTIPGDGRFVAPAAP
jgi:hypothetical protein